MATPKDDDYNPLEELDAHEELRKLAMTEQEIFRLFVLAGSIAMGIHLTLDPEVDFDEQADPKMKRLGRENLIRSTIIAKDVLGELLTHILERYEENEQKEADTAFSEIIKNLGNQD